MPAGFGKKPKHFNMGINQQNTLNVNLPYNQRNKIKCYSGRYSIIYTLPTFFSTSWDLQILTNTVHVTQMAKTT